MKAKFWISILAVATVISLAVGAEAKTKRYHYTQPTGDVEYNATENSPTLPLVQSPPPQNYQTSVQVGTPSYYYYYPPMGGYYGGSGYYGNVPQAGVNYFNVNGRAGHSFWGTVPIPGQVAPPYGGGFGPGYGGFGPGYGPGYYPPYIGNTLFVP